MPVEHRRYERRPTQAIVELSRGGRLFRRATAVNISAAGMAIESAGLRLRYGSRLSITVIDSEANPALPKYFNAVVIHTSEDSAGLMWMGVPEHAEVKRAS